MDGWMDKWTDGQRDEWMHEQMTTPLNDLSSHTLCTLQAVS